MARTTPVVLLALLLLAPALPGSASSPVRMLVGFHDAPPVSEGDRFQGAQVVRVDDALRFAVVDVLDVQDFEARTREDDRVRYVEPDAVLSALYVPNDPLWNQQYGPRLVAAPAAWDRTLGSTSTSVCVTDSGVRYTHQDLAGPRWLGGIDLINDDTDPWDDHGHGTHVTGIAAATTSNGKTMAGIAQASFRHAKILGSDGRGPYSAFASAFRWCADQGSLVVSASVGGGSSSTAMSDAIAYAWSKGTISVVSAGNEGCAGCVLYPARYEPAIAVACITSSKALCSFSSRGPEVDIAAPGLSVVSTMSGSDTDTASWSGTSMSAPHVSGVLALMRASNPTYSHVELRARLLATAEDLGAAGRDDSFGAGLVRADLALAPTPCSNGVDDDGDGRIDFPTDPGCTGNLDETEAPDPTCSNLRDDDGDGRVDADDPGCSGTFDGDERDPLWRDDFEGGGLRDDLPVADPWPRALGLPGWRKSGPADLWHIESGCGSAASGSKKLAFARPPFADTPCTYNVPTQRVSGYAEIGPLDVTGRSALLLRFAHRMDLEDQPRPDREVMRVLVSGDGATWTTLHRWHNAAPGPATWTELLTPVPTPATGALWLRFDADTMDNIANDGEGWFIDDVELIG